MTNPKEDPKKFWTKERLDKAITLANNGKTWDEVGELMGISREGVARAVRRYKAVQRQDAHPQADFTREAIGTIIKNKNITKGMFFVTAAAPTDPDGGKLQKSWYVGANLHEAGFAAIQSFCALNGAELIIHPLPTHIDALRDQPNHYDPKLKPYIKSFATEFVFNKYLRSIDIGINPQLGNPLAGLSRMRGKGDRNSSVIVAHTKQNMKMFATGNSTAPRLMHSTGCITLPAYRKNRVGRIAEEDHVVGGLVVVVKGSTFFIHQVQIRSEEGSFNYMGVRYFANGKTRVERAEAMKLGDIHYGRQSAAAMAATYEMMAKLQPKEIFVEDIFDGTSINPHTWSDLFQKGTPPEQFASLDKELSVCRDGMLDLWVHSPTDCKINVTASNHNDFLDRYLKRGQYLQDSVNYATGHRMVVDKLDGKDPLQTRVDPDNKYTWLGINDDILIEGCNMSSHGHLAANGAKGAQVGVELAYDNGMFAHTHTPGILNNAWWVGHLSEERHGYNTGASTWQHCNGVVYKNGEKCLLFVINGKWK